MNKSIVLGALLIGAAVISSPFVYDYVKTEQKKEQFNKRSEQKEITDVLALEIASESYREKNGACPESADVLVGDYIRRIPKDRYRNSYIYLGDCEFESLSGVNGDF